MASRTGGYVQGTDGTDYSHREKVATHYRQSAVWKGKIKYSIIPHLLLAFVGVIWIAVSGFRDEIDKPAPWQLLWIVSGMCAFSALSSLSENSKTLIGVYFVGSILLGIIPVMYGSSVVIFKIAENYMTGKSLSGTSWEDSPWQLGLLAVILQIHIFGLYYGYKLRGAWNTKGEKRK